MKLEQEKEKWLKKLIEEVKKMPLCYDDGITEPEDEGSFIEGEAHFKDHILDLLNKKKENYDKKTRN